MDINMNEKIDTLIDPHLKSGQKYPINSIVDKRWVIRAYEKDHYFKALERRRRAYQVEDKNKLTHYWIEAAKFNAGSRPGNAKMIGAAARKSFKPKYGIGGSKRSWTVISVEPLPKNKNKTMGYFLQHKCGIKIWVKASNFDAGKIPKCQICGKINDSILESAMKNLNAIRGSSIWIGQSAKWIN